MDSKYLACDYPVCGIAPAAAILLRGNITGML
jgi:hypothetical protein